MINFLSVAYRMIQFLLNDELVEIDDKPADLTLLDFLREHKKLTGTKEGCASGDCGACTVVIAEIQTQPAGHQNSSKILKYKAINSCITFLSALHRKQVITVEYLNKSGRLHPVQQFMVDTNATQCGFCTPGFVMSIFALYQNSKFENQVVSRETVINALSGNLCRCTGYKPIIEAAVIACNTPELHSNTEQSGDQQVFDKLERIPVTYVADSASLLPTNRQQLAQCIINNPNAQLVAGSTDLALMHTQQLQSLPVLISLKYIPQLSKIAVIDDVLVIGAACTISDAEQLMLEYFPDLKELIERFASVPIRNQATIGGNIANASPIGDLPPVLLSLNATLLLDNGEKTRQVALKEFFTGYKETILFHNEWIDSIHIPLLKPEQTLKAYKVSKRMEDDISAVCMSVCITLKDGIVSDLSTGFGGVAATPSRCEMLENEIKGRHWYQEENVAVGKRCLSGGFNPISDVRASAAYRQSVLKNLWHRFWLETNQRHQNIQLRVSDHA